MLKKIYHSYRRRKRKRRFAPYTKLDSNSYYANGFNVDLRRPVDSKIYIETGEHCVLDGNYIFETGEGKIQIGDRVHIGNSTFISRNAIVIEDDVTIAWNCLIYDHNSHSTIWGERSQDTEREYQNLKDGRPVLLDKDWDVVKSSPIHICQKVWIGTGVTILKGVTIGEGAIVGAGSVVTKDVEPWSVVGGNPAQFIKKLERNE